MVHSPPSLPISILSVAFAAIITIIVLPSVCGHLTKVVHTRYGSVQGIRLPAPGKSLKPIDAYFGIPYASPPTGTNRFSPTRTPIAWEGVRLMTAMSPVCPQRLPDISNDTAALETMPKGRLAYLKKLLPYLRNQSEDCLYLNIYAPTRAIFLNHNFVIGNDVLHFINAVRTSSIPEAKRLLETTVSMDDIIRADYPLLLATLGVFGGGAEMARFLISKGAGSLVNTGNSFGHTPLLYASYKYAGNEKGVYEIMEAFLAAGADPNANTFYPHYRAPLHYIVFESLTRLLISYGANVDIQMKGGLTPAHLAVIGQNYGVLRALIAGNANLSAVNAEGDTIFHSYSTTWTREMVHLLATNGVPIQNHNRRGETPLTKFLKTDITRRNNQLFTPNQECHRLRYEYLDDSVYGYMLEVGADINCCNREGRTLLHIAVLGNHPEVAKWLLDKGAYVDALDGKMDTPLLALLKQERNSRLPKIVLNADSVKGVIDVLVAAGANVQATDLKGRNAWHHFKRINLTSIDANIKKSIEKTLKSKNGQIF